MVTRLGVGPVRLGPCGSKKNREGVVGLQPRKDTKKEFGWEGKIWNAYPGVRERY